MFICVWGCMYVYVFMCVCMWTPEVDVKGLFQPFSNLIFETRSHMDPEAHWFGKTAGQ